ncbi:GNAT family N-acetyltransferase [Croceibacterium salegens]|uniref:GNAT family N-acetyltransferase n=1 Tax=Croceibacterium salegens TaxID=1737568 RepID=UPI002E25929C
MLPAHQGRGLGKAIMHALLEALAAQIAAPAYVSLVADGDARHLYSHYGFRPVAPKSIGMACWLQPSISSSDK